MEAIIVFFSIATIGSVATFQSVGKRRKIKYSVLAYLIMLLMATNIYLIANGCIKANIVHVILIIPFTALISFHGGNVAQCVNFFTRRINKL